jgi:hypothetical protein
MTDDEGKSDNPDRFIRPPQGAPTYEERRRFHLLVRNTAQSLRNATVEQVERVLKTVEEDPNTKAYIGDTLTMELSKKVREAIERLRRS